MGSLVAAGFLAFFVASLMVGVRLLLLWRRTRELPELLIGIGVLGIGPVGFGAMMLGSQLLQHSGQGAAQAARVCFALGTLTVYIGVISKCVFNWRVYHPTSPAVRGLVAGIALLLAGLYVHAFAVRGFVMPATPDRIALLQSTLQVGCLLWGSAEALRYFRLMRRRLALGLADRVVTNRFLLWGIGAGAAGLGSAIGTIASSWLGRASLEIPWVVASSSAHGLIAAIAMALAFLPPAAYLRWLQPGAVRVEA